MRFARLAACFDQLEEINSRNAMVVLLAELFQEAAPAEVDELIYLGQGRLLPAFERLEFGVGEALLGEAIAMATQTPSEEVRRRFVAIGDYGSLVATLLAEKDAAGDVTVHEVYSALHAVSTASGKGAQGQKTGLLAGILARCGPAEAKHVARIVLGRLRLGIGDPTVMDGLSYARAGTKEDRKVLERAYNLCSDLGLVARTYLEGGAEALAAIRVQVGKPVRPALCERVGSPAALIERLGRCAVEPKVDGFRCQVNKADDGQLRAYSRNLEDMSAMFPEIVEALRGQAEGHTVIVEGEAVGFDPGTLEFHPFQVTVQRRRKHGIADLRETLPLKLLAFDLLYLNGDDLTPLPYRERRQRLVDLFGAPIDFSASGAAVGPVIQPNDARELEDVAAVEAFFATTVERGQEGIVAKRLDAPYQAGARNFSWIKLKRSYRGELNDTIDCVVVGYWYGKGHRTKLGIGTLLTAVYDQERDVFTTVTRLGTGFSEEEWARLKGLLDEVRAPQRPARVESALVPDVWCRPQYVVEIQADEITRSPLHSTGRRWSGPGPGAGPGVVHAAGDASGATPQAPETQVPEAGENLLGYALRFPRAVGFLRADRQPEDATTVGEVIGLFQKQGQRAVGGGSA